jgi:hypothetical protein
MSEIFKILIFIHFAWHAIAALGVTAAIWHSYDAHKHSKWKIALALLWLTFSIALLFIPEDSACH